MRVTGLPRLAERPPRPGNCVATSEEHTITITILKQGGVKVQRSL
jgi:hypothetical protein